MNKRDIKLLLSLHKRGLSEEICTMTAIDLSRNDSAQAAELITEFFKVIYNREDFYTLRNLLQEVTEAPETLAKVSEHIHKTLEKFTKS
jgi:hypothetical protein